MVPKVAKVVMVAKVAKVTTVAKVAMVAMVQTIAEHNAIGLENDVQRKVQDYHSKEECLIMQTNAGKWRR